MFKIKKQLAQHLPKIFEIVLLKGRVALLQKEQENIEKRTNPLKSKLLKNVEESKRLYEDIKQKEKEYEQFSYYEREKDQNVKRLKKNLLKFSSNEALQFAREHAQKERKKQALKIKQLHQQHKLLIKMNQYINQKIQYRCEVQNQKQYVKEKLKEFHQNMQQKLQEINNIEKSQIKQELNSKDKEIRALEELEMRFLQKLIKSKMLWQIKVLKQREMSMKSKFIQIQIQNSNFKINLKFSFLKYIMTETIENLRDFNYYQLTKDVNKTVVLAEYIWIDGTGESLRSKTKVYQTQIKTLEDLEWWTYDGSSTDQAVTRFSEIYLKPVRLVKDPFRGDPHILVLCETYLPDKKTPARYNFRWIANQIMVKAKDHKPWFGIEQEYFLLKRTGTTHLWPLGWPTGGFPYPQGRYYCSIGERNNFGRALAEAHLRACLNAGLKIAGLNAEVAPSQWEFQIGIAEGIEIGDHMWLARYILERIGEEFGIDINYDPKPILGDWNGSGAHCNYSTVTTRSEGGYRYIVDKLMPILKDNHIEMIKLYGQKNELRLTGRHETGKYDQFTWGDGSRGCSVRVPIITKEQGQGYFEDRRPAANIDPYLVSAALVDVTCLKGEHLKQLNSIFEDSLKPLGQQIFQQQKEQFQQSKE